MLSNSELHQTAGIANRSVGDWSNSYSIDPFESQGFSGTSIYRLTNSKGRFAIRGWPSDLSSEHKVAFWQACNASCISADLTEPLTPASLAATQSQKTKFPVAPFPQLYFWDLAGALPSFLLTMGQRQWTLSDWVEGRAIERDDIHLDLVHHLATVLGAIHRNSVSIIHPSANSRHDQMPSPSIGERLRFIATFDERCIKLASKLPFFQKSQLADRVVECLSHLIVQRPAWTRFLDSSAFVARKSHWIVRDLWYENVLVDSTQQFVSIVDLGAARLDWPGLDFVRLFGSMIGSRAVPNPSSHFDWWSSALDSYAASHPQHAIESLEECIALHTISCSLSIAQWVGWISSGRFPMGDDRLFRRIACRISELCNQVLETPR
jgi:hypothetical protein